jgi:hypothetical protein
VLSWLLLAAPACDETGEAPGGADPDFEAIAAAEIGTAADQGTELDSAEGTDRDEAVVDEGSQGGSEPVSDPFLSPESAVGHEAMTRMAPEEKQSSWAEGVYVRDECCTEPGQAAECWEQDADDDGVTCEVNADCPSGSCDTSTVPGLCECSDDDECNDGVCIDSGVCGPSWCNGYKICSCWGGCVWWHANDSYTPEDMCDAQDLFCCDGGYPSDPTAGGFCSNSSTCGEGECDDSTDCTDHVGNVCVQALCMDNQCFYPAVDAGNCASVVNPGETWADQPSTCCCNVDSDCPEMPCVDDVYCDIDPGSGAYHQCIYVWAAEGASCEGEGSDPFGIDDNCGTWECTAVHECVEVPHDGDPCDAASGGPGGDNDDCGEYYCQGVDCVEFFDAAGSACPNDQAEPDDDCGWWGCDGVGSCVEYYDAVGAACPNDQPESNDDCGTWGCDGSGSCVESHDAAGTICPNDQLEPNDNCGDWACDGGGDCIEYTHAGAACDQGNDGPGGVNDECGQWICQADGDCIENTALFDGAPCTLAGDTECNYGVCDSGACIEQFEPVGTACNSAANDDCGTWACDGSGGCVESFLPVGTACPNDQPEANDNCGSWACDGSGSCAESAHPGVACDSASGGPGGANDNCGKWFCDGSANCVEQTAAYAGAACDAASGGPSAENNDNCGTWLCDGSGGCAESYHSGAACDMASGGPGGANDDCGTWVCNASGGCQEVTGPYDGNYCGGTGTVDPCDDVRCLNGNCDDYDLIPGDICDPGGDPDYCNEYACNNAHQCVDNGPAFPPPNGSYEDCSPGNDMGTVSGTSNWYEDNACADDNYDPDTSGRFGTCPAQSYADYVTHYDVFVGSGYTMNHLVARLQRQDTAAVDRSNNDSWDPYMYSYGQSSLCGSGAYQYTCNDDCDYSNTNYSGAGSDCTSLGAQNSSLTLGPWPLRDNPTTADSDGYTTDNTWDGSVAVDSRLSSGPYPEGGEFRLRLTKEAHQNDDCRNTASYVAAPIIASDPTYGFWRDRWRGTTSGYDNYRNVMAIANQNNCDGFGTVAGITSAFFRLDLEAGVSASGWPHRYKIWTDPNGTETLINVLALWGGSDSQCNLSGSGACDNSPWNRPQEHIFQGGYEGWLEVSNRWSGQQGTYELNVLRSPRPFLGLTEQFMGESAADACGDISAASAWTLYGYRLDFIPTNDALEGYAVRSTNVGPGNWLVNPYSHALRCKGAACANNPPGAFPLPFTVPYSGGFYRYYRIDPAGRIDFTNDSGLGGSYDRKPDSYKQTITYAPSLIPAWGGLIPCWCSETTGGGWGMPPEWSGSCHHDDDGHDGEGWIRSGTAVYENQTVEVITWSGFDSYVNPWGYDDAGWSDDTKCKRSSSDETFEFQVIVFPDGQVTYYYRSTESETAMVLDWTAWSVGVQGTRHATSDCPDGGDAWCDTHMGASPGELKCDYETDDHNTYTPGYRCINPEEDLYTGIAGSWNGGL